MQHFLYKKCKWVKQNLYAGRWAMIFKICFIFSRKILVLASSDENYNSIIEWFIYHPLEETWTKHNFPMKVQFPTKPNWFLVPIFGELHLFLPNDTLKYHTETTKWTQIDQLIDLHVEDIDFLSVAYKQK